MLRIFLVRIFLSGVLMDGIWITPAVVQKHYRFRIDLPYIDTFGTVNYCDNISNVVYNDMFKILLKFVYQFFFFIQGYEN